MTEEVIDRAKSLQVLTEWLQGDKNFQPQFSLKTARSIVYSDPLVSAALETEANKVIEGGWGIKSNRKADGNLIEERFKRKYRFNSLLHTLVRNLRWKDGLIEIAHEQVVTVGDTIMANDQSPVADLNLLDQENIDVDAKSNGDVNFYYQDNVKDGQSKRKWLPRNIVHIKFKDAILNLWGDSDLRVAYETVLIKDFIRKFLAWLFGTNQFRNHIGFKQTVSEDQVRKFISYYKEGENSYGKPAITDGEVEIKALRELKDLDQVLLILDYCDKELMRLLQQTGLSLGEGSSGRADADGLSDTQRTSIKAIQRVIMEAVNYELLPKMGYSSGVEFYWKPLDRLTEKGLFEIIEIMKRSMFTDEAILEFMEKQGMSFETKKLFKEPEEITGVTPEQRSKKDASASRESKGVGESNKRIGTGEQSTTREEQVSRAAPVNGKKIPDFGKYPYVIEKEVTD